MDKYTKLATPAKRFTSKRLSSWKILTWVGGYSLVRIVFFYLFCRTSSNCQIIFQRPLKLASLSFLLCKYLKAFPIYPYRNDTSFPSMMKTFFSVTHPSFFGSIRKLTPKSTFEIFSASSIQIFQRRISAIFCRENFVLATYALTFLKRVHRSHDSK